MSSLKEKKHKKIFKIFTIALAIRKFQNYESNSFKKTIAYNFDKNETIANFERDYKSRKDFYLKDVNNFIYIIRKFKLNFHTFKFIHNLPNELINLIKTNKTQQVLLSQLFKYLVKNNSSFCDVKLYVLIDFIKSNKNHLVNKEIAYSICYLIENDPTGLDSDEINNLKIVLSSIEIESEAKSFLFEIIEKIQTLKSKSLIIDKLNYDSEISMSKSKSTKKQQLIVSKTIQTVKAKQKNTKSEKENVKLSSLADALKSREKKQNINRHMDKIPNIVNGPNGDDQFWTRSTWGETVNLYQLTVEGGRSLKKGDKDNYLPDKLFGSQWVLGLVGAKSIYRFFLNKMIVAIFKKTSKSQRLNEMAISKLMKCICSLGDLCKLLDFKETKLVEYFVSEFRNDFKKIIELNEPEIFCSFTKKFVAKTIDYSWSWYYGYSTEEKEFNYSEVNKLIEEQINQLRLDSVETIYNCALVDKAILTKSRMDQFLNCLRDDLLKNTIIKIIGLIDSTDLVNYMELFQVCLDELKKNSNLEQSVNYILDQSKDSMRCKELFNDLILNDLLGLIEANKLDSKINEYLIEIILNYVGHDKTDNLNENQLNALISFIEKKGVPIEIKNSCVLIILNTAQKCKTLSNEIIKQLVTNMNSCNLNENQSNLLLICFNHIFNGSIYLKETILLEKISPKLIDENVVVEKERKILFETRSKTNSKCNSIAYLAANILYYSIKKSVSLNDKIVNDIRLGLDNEDKQARIQAARCLYELAKYYSIENHRLVEIKEYLNDSVVDVNIYCQLAYVIGLRRISKTSRKSIGPIHLDLLPELFVFETLKLDNNDFTDEINICILEIIQKEISLNQKNANIFSLLEMILAREKYGQKAAKILLDYTSKPTNNLPVACIVSVENALNFEDLHDDSLIILKNVIRNGQIVSNKTLKLISDSFYLPVSARDHLNSFKILEKARLNQEISNDIFVRLELVKAGYGLEVNDNKEPILNFLLDQTFNGNHLPINALDSLTKKINTNKTAILKIIINLTNNKQVIQADLFKKLDELFDLNNSDIDLLAIFENLVKNNQVLANETLKKLENSIDNNKSIEKNILSIFVYLAQKGEFLSKNIINRILNKLLNEKPINQDYLSSISSIIKTHKKEIDAEKIERILLNGIQSKILNIQLMSLKSMTILIEYKKISDETVGLLLKIGTSSKDDKRIKNAFYLLIKSKYFDQYLSDQTRNEIDLAYLDSDTNQQLLNKLDEYVSNKNVGLLEQNYDQLKSILEINYDLQAKAISVLKKAKNKDKINNDLMESIAVLFESTTSKEIKKDILTIFKEIKMVKKDFSLKTLNILDYSDVNSKLEAYLTNFNRTNKQNDLIPFLKEYIQNNLDCYYDNNIVVSLIEQLLSINTEEVLVYYSRIIFEKKYQNIDVLDNVKVNSIEAEIALAECVSALFKFENLSDACFNFLEESLNKNHKKLRYFAFKGLKNAEQFKESLVFVKFCQKTKENILKNLKIEIDDNLLEILTQLEYIDLKVFDRAKNDWPRDLLISNLFEIFKNDNDSKFLKFYQTWFELEEKLSEDSLEILKELTTKLEAFKSIDNLIDTIEMMSNLNETDQIRNVLKYADIYNRLKINITIEFIRNKLENKEIDLNYVKRLAQDICNLYDYSFIKAFFDCLTVINNLSVFNFTIKFCADNRFKTRDLIFIKNVNIIEFKQQLLAKNLCNQFSFSYSNDLFNILKNLLSKNWSLDQLVALINQFKKLIIRNEVQNTIDLFNLIDKYNLASTNYEKCLNLISNNDSDFDGLIQGINTLVIENNFQSKGKIKTSSELIQELIDSNPDKNFEELEQDLNEIKNPNLKSKIFEAVDNGEILPIIRWNIKQVELWSMHAKKNGIKKCLLELNEFLAVINQATHLLFKFRLTDSQLISSLISLKNDSHTKGRLIQVATGEGKSIIVCILAIFNALQGKKVYVITSSPVLAERDAKDKARLYKLFNLTVSDNSDKTLYVKGAKDAYTKDIVYGEVSQFQFDTLRDQYGQLYTLAGTKCEIAIVDEVDSMLIDDSSKIARLSTTIAGMDHFHSVYFYIWNELNTLINEKIITINGRIFLVFGKFSLNAEGKFRLEYADDDGKINEINNLEVYLNDPANDLNKICIEISSDIEDYLKNNLNTYLDTLLKEKTIKIPVNFVDYFSKQKLKWINNAIEALNYQENIHYIVQDGQIKPVDFNSTGIVQSSTNWSDGLHQFLQIKHNLKMTSETFTTNFLSNVGYFKDSFEKIYGLTGTLGSCKAREVLEAIYQVDLVNIPQLRTKQYLELPATLVENERDWLEQIYLSAMIEAKKMRSTLIICETIAHANRIAEKIKSQYRSSAVKLYTMNNLNQEKQIEKTLPGDVIIATNLGKLMKIQF
jgi:hypothetical protein